MTHHSDKQTVLFVSIYAETLKSMLPYIRAIEDSGFNVKILAKHYPFGNDKQKTISLLDGFHYDLIESLDLGDMTSWRSGSCLISRWHRLLSTLKCTVPRAWIANIQSKKILSEINPSVIIVGSDGRLLERHLIKNGHILGIPSICIQWTLSVVSLNSLHESKTRKLLDEKTTFYSKIDNFLFRHVSFLVKVINGAGLRFAGLRTPLRIKGRYGLRIHGQGNADRLALIGNASKSFHLQMGTPSTKLQVVGSPSFDAKYNKYLESLDSTISSSCEKESILDKYSLDPSRKVVLIANNDSKKQYLKYYSNKEIVLSWRKRIMRLLAIHGNIQVIFKLHPVWNSSDEFLELEGLTDNLRVLKTGDMEDLIKVTSVLVVRHSMAALEGIVQNVPTVSINSPPIPAGGFYKEVGGTIHAGDDDEFVSIVSRLLNDDPHTTQLASQMRFDFLQNYLGIDTSNRDETAKKRFVSLLKELILTTSSLGD